MHLGAMIKLDDLIANGLTAGPVSNIKDMGDAELNKARDDFETAGVIAAQTGGYCNLISVDEGHRRECVVSVRRLLEKAERVGCRSVVVGGGHRDPSVPTDIFSAHPENWSDYATDLLAESCREVLDGWASDTTGLVIETWVMTPVDSPRAARKLASSVNHQNFGILFDPVNMMNLDRHFRTGDLIAECVNEFGEWIELVHLKDTRIMADRFTYHMAEVPIGDGNMDYPRLLRELTSIGEDLPLIVEHLANLDDYIQAITRIRSIAADEGIEFSSPSDMRSSARVTQ